MKSHLNLEYIKFLSKIIPIKNIQALNNEIVLTVSYRKIAAVLQFFKNHTGCQYKILSSISGTGYIEKKNRFEISYELLSIQYNSRIRIKVNVDETTSVDSAISIYSTADWWEREIWDMFGVSFRYHFDLRRILTDYGFDGYPLRKDFPLSGYVEVRYDEHKKRVIHKPLELAQEFRTFDFVSPWNQTNDQLKLNVHNTSSVYTFISE